MHLPLTVGFALAALGLYTLGTALHLVALAWPRLGRWRGPGDAALGLGFLIQAVSFGLTCRRVGGAEFLTLGGGLALLAWLSCGAYLAVPGLRRLPALGAFVGPALLLAALPGLSSASTRGGLAKNLASWLLPVHVTLSFLSLAVFTLAFAVSAMYLLMERELGSKRFGAFFVRLPALVDLDRLNQRLLLAGFVVFGLSLVSGALFAHRVWGAYWSWDPIQLVSLLAWLLYGALLWSRRLGWHGRRTALGCMLGLALLLVSFVGMSILGVGRHAGSFQ